MTRPHPTTALVALPLLALGSCTVYAPMQPVAPAVRQAHQAELMASLQPTGRVEVTGAYSPASRVLVTGGVTGAAQLNKENFLATRQYEVGMGYYQPLNQHWVLSGVGGFGQAYSRRGHTYNFLGSRPYHEYDAHYRKTFGQLGAVYQRHVYGLGLTYRFVWLNFDYLNDSQEGALPLSTAMWHELAVTNRVQVAPRLQLLNTAGLSVPGTPWLGYNHGTPDYARAVDEANRNLTPTFFLSLGVAYQLGPSMMVPRRLRPTPAQPPSGSPVRRRDWGERLRQFLRD